MGAWIALVMNQVRKWDPGFSLLEKRVADMQKEEKKKNRMNSLVLD